MDLAFISGFLATLASLCGLFFAIYTVRRMNQKLETFEGLAQTAGEFLRYEEDEEGNPMIDARLSKMIKMFSSGLATSLKMSALGALSGPARLDKGLKGAMAADVVENKMPIINLLGDVFGINTKKYITKHPDALLQLAQKFMPGFLQQNNPGQSSGM